MFVQVVFSTYATVRTLHEVGYDTQKYDKTSSGLLIDLYVNIVFSTCNLSFCVKRYLYFFISQ